MPAKRKLAIIGLGYVGLTIAAAFGQNEAVIGFDINPERIAELKKGHDRNGEISFDYAKNAQIKYTTNPEDLRQADFYIVTVLTPINKTNNPDLTALLKATATIGAQLKKGDIVVYVSTVYPGATEEECIPLLERASKLVCGQDFSVGYSPERINPGDKEHTFFNVMKIISAFDKDTLNIISEVYKTVVTAGVYPVSSIRVAEATKVVENTQRDLNISLVNEIALILHNLGMDSTEVLTAAQTKWNYLPFRPGLVGGHCIGVNSYYLTYKAEEAGYHPEVILAGQRVNAYISKFIAEKTIKKLIHLGVPIKKARIAVLGLTYKENYSDLHDTRVIELIKELESYDTQVFVHDPIADHDTAKKLFSLDIQPLEALVDIDAIIIAVAHEYYINLESRKLKAILKNHGLIMDVKGVLNPKDFIETGISIWKL